MRPRLLRRSRVGPHLDTTTRNFLPLPARNEWEEGRGQGHSIKSTSSPRPSPPLREEREKSWCGRVVVLLSCAGFWRGDEFPFVDPATMLQCGVESAPRG